MDSALRAAALRRSRVGAASPVWVPFIGNAVGLVALLVVLSVIDPYAASLRAGQVAGETIVAQQRVMYVDRAATAARRSQAAAAVQPVYRTDTSLATHRAGEARAFLAGAPAVLQGVPAPKRLADLRALLPSDLTSDSLQEFASLSPADLDVVSRQSLSLLEQAVAWRFESHQLTAIEFGLLSTVPARVTLLQRTAIGEILATFLAPTLLEDQKATAQRRKQAAAAIAPVTETIYQGEVVVRRGDLITSSIMDRLEALGIQSRRVGWQDVTASLLFALVIVVVLFWYLFAFHGEILTNRRLLVLLDAGILAAVLGARLFANGHVILPYFLPVAAISTFAAVLIAPEACFALTLAMAVMAGWVVANSFEVTTFYFFTGAAGVLAIRQIRQVKQFVFAGIFIAGFGLLTLLAFALLARGYDAAALQNYVLAAAFNGFVSSALALGGFALLSSFFGVTTPLQLLELGQPGQPLLNRLMVKAPGTYNHSLIVATMVERAAQDTGANSLAAKISALYHDAGKVTNPQAFVENQLGTGNLHDELRPEESARIIRGHVSQGLRLARQHHLPRVILDAIAEHHGTMTIAYFLHRARQENPDVWVDDSLYSYAGPKPQSKETALLMLADGCESTVRAASDHSQANIREIVERIFQERITLGQLDECPLTLKDLEQARSAFCAVLNGLYHPRIEYPELVEPIFSRADVEEHV